MFDAALRQANDRVGAPLALRMSAVSPNAVSIGGFVVGLIAAWQASQGNGGAAVTLWLFSRILDGLDGLIARLHGKQSDFGGYLDIVLDFVVYAAVPIGLTVHAPTSERFVALAVMLSSFYVNAASWMMLAAILEKRGRADGGLTTVTMPPGLVGALESIVAYTVFLIWPEQSTWLFGVFTGLVALTIGQRLMWAWRHLR